MFYRVHLERDDNGTLLATFPDVPGAVSFGETEADALAHATDALLTVFDALMRDRRDLPPPSPLGGLGITVPVLDASKIELYRTASARHADTGR
jgi:antitoxin HicB